MLNENQLKNIINTILGYTPYDISGYAKASLYRRFQRVLLNHRIEFNDLIHKIKTDKEFSKNLIEEITVNTTELFRDPKIWAFLRTEILPLFEVKKNIKIWIPGCSTGQEAYSMAILLNELGLLDKTEIYASDINSKVLEIASKGVYRYKNNLNYLSNFTESMSPNSAMTDLAKEELFGKYFEINRSNDQIIIFNFLKDKITFLQNDLVSNDKLPISNFDLISCRNVLIYMNQGLQNKILEKFYKNILPGAFLLLGTHESIIGSNSRKFKKKDLLYISV